MTAQSVEAVWVVRYGDTTFKPIYRRMDGAYSRDYIALGGECGAALYKLFPALGDGHRVDVVYAWPGGTQEGHLAVHAHDDPRVDIRWTTSSSPLPWRLYPDADINPLATFPGDPTKTTAHEADAELELLKARNLDPWLVLVKLHGEATTLHVRAYLGSPSPELERASTEQLPLVVRNLIAGIPGNRNCAVVEVPRATAPRAARLMREVLDALERGPNVLLVGPPGTGKTVVLEDLRRFFELGSDGLLFDPDLLHSAWSVPSSATRGHVRTLVFHPSYSYEEFVIGLYPRASTVGIELEARPGPLLSLAHWASDAGRSALLVADEFNRGNAAAIFGDTLALLDKEKRSDPVTGQLGAAIDRPYPDAKVEVAPEFANTDGVEVPRRITLPLSLWIVAAMNSSDRSVAPLDAALRRRFSIVRVDPDYDVLAVRYGIAADQAVRADDPATWGTDDVLGLSLNLLRSMNAKIELILGPDFLLGHALLWDVGGDTAEAAVESLAAAFDERVVASLRMTFADQDDPLGALLGVGTAPTTQPPVQTAPKFAHWIMPSPDLAAVAPPRLRLRPAASFGWTQAAVAFRDLV
jgi:5-methylcytosine-specific restriction protein B